MLKNNNKGFVLVETLVVAVFVMAIFSVIYTNFYPIMGEYEKRESYDDIDSKYAAFWFKRIIQSESVNFTNILTDIGNKKYHEFVCNDIIDSDATARKICNDLRTRLGVEKIYITNYKIGNRNNIDDKNNFKGIVDGNSIFSSGLQDYVAYLPTYSKVSSLNGACYRLIIEFHHTRNDNDFYTYSDIEILKGTERCWS